MAETLTHDDFLPHLGKEFRFSGWHGVLTLEKVDVRQDRAMPNRTTPPFSAIFHGPRGDVLPEGLYEAKAGDAPGLSFYIMPIHTRAPDRQDYQAVFN